MFVLVVVVSFAKAGGGVGAAGGDARGTIFAAGGAIGFRGFAFFIGIRVDVAFQTGRLPFAVLVLADGTCQAEITVHWIVFAQVASRTKTAAFFGCFVSFDALGTTTLIGVTLCKSNWAFDADVEVFKFPRYAIGTFSAAIFGGTAGSAFATGKCTMFVIGRRIFRATFAFFGSNGIIEFTLQIKH